MHQIPADRVTPIQFFGNGIVAQRIVLEEKMIFAIEINQPIGVIHPAVIGGEMELGTIGFIVRSRGGAGGSAEDGCESNNARKD